MDIARITLANTPPSDPGSLASTVGIAMLDQSIELQQDMSASMIRMMELSVSPGIGGNFDVSV